MRADGKAEGPKGRLVHPAHPSPWSGSMSPGALIFLEEVGGLQRGGGEQAMRPPGGVRCGKKHGDQGPTLAHLGWSITRLHDVASCGLKRSIWAAQHGRRGLPAPPSSWPQPPSSASGQLPALAQSRTHRRRALSTQAQAPGAAGVDPGAEEHPRELAAGWGGGDRAGAAGWGRGGRDPGGRGGTDWPGAAT